MFKNINEIFNLLTEMIDRLMRTAKTNEGGMVTYAPNTVGEDSFLAAEYIPN